MKDYRFELKYTAENLIDVDYYIEKARVERAEYIANLFRKAFFKKNAQGNKARVSFLQQSPAH